MMDEHGCSFEEAQEYSLSRDPMTAVLPHPVHGRLVERVIFVVHKYLCCKGTWYTLNWRDDDLAFYEPVTPCSC